MYGSIYIYIYRVYLLYIQKYTILSDKMVVRICVIASLLEIILKSLPGGFKGTM